MRVLVTGSLGYLGSVLTGYLQQHGAEVVGYDTGIFKDCLLYDRPTVPTLMRDVRDFRESDLDGFDAMVHLSGISNDPLRSLDPVKVYDPTRAYTFELAKLCKKRGVKFVFSSSCSVYGKGEDGLVNEDSTPNPQTPYSLNKVQVEQDLQSLSDRSFSPIALRFATAFGLSPCHRFDLVTNMLSGMALTTGKIILNSDGTPWRPNVHVLDICKAVKGALDLDYREGRLLVLNVGDEKNNLQIIDIARKVQEAVPGCELHFLKDNPNLDKEGLVNDRKVKAGVDTRTYRVSFEKIRRVLPGFTCDWSVETGVRDMVDRLRTMGLTEPRFKNTRFYRLQTIEALHREGYISDELRWIRPRP